MITLPHRFKQTIKRVHGKKGESWLDHFHELYHSCEKKWSLNLLPPFPLSYNFVAPAVRADGTELVLKLCVPSKEVCAEIEALRLYRGNGVARLVDADEDKGILILERLSPGDTLKSVKNDEEATEIAARLIRQINTPAPSNSIFPSTADWSLGLKRLRKQFEGGTGPIPEWMVNQADAMFTKLNATIKNPRLLHGDLHHENILSNGDNWLAIDPKGLIGETEYEVIPFLINNLLEVTPAEVIKQRVDIFVQQLDIQKDRVYAWAFCHAVLAAWWCIEDRVEGVERFLEKAVLFNDIGT